MNSQDVRKAILEEAQRISDSIPAATWYGFGSYFRGEASFQDVDVLVVCVSHDEAVALRKATDEICSQWPLHLVIMTEREAAETAFIQSQECTVIHGSDRGARRAVEAEDV